MFTLAAFPDLFKGDEAREDKVTSKVHIWTSCWANRILNSPLVSVEKFPLLNLGLVVTGYGVQDPKGYIVRGPKGPTGDEDCDDTWEEKPNTIPETAPETTPSVGFW